MIRRIGLVAWHVFKESVRDRVLYSFVGFAVLLIGASILIGQITAGQDVKIIKDLGLAAIELVGVLMAVFIGVGLVAKEIDRRSIYSLLAKPLHRREFIAGKYLGLVLTIVVNVALMTVAFYVMLGWMAWTMPEAVQKAWEAPAVDPALLVSIGLIVVELALLTAIALFFSTFSSNALLSVLFSLGLYVSGLFSLDIKALAGVVPSGAMAMVLRAVGAVLPAFHAFDIKTQVVHGLAIDPGYVGLTVLYGVVYAGVVMGAAVAVFSRREFT